MNTVVFSRLRILTGAILIGIPGFLIAQQIPSPSPSVSPSPATSPSASPTDTLQGTTASFPLPTSGAIPPVITAKAAILFDAHTGKIILKHNETQPRQVASTQKLLTALIIVESGNLDQPVTIEKSDTTVLPTKLGIRPGDVYTRRGLLVALLVKSANDVAVALARDNAGSVAAFADKMNRRMAELHGNSSHFVNPNGLPCDAQYSTARDMAIVARTVYSNPLLREIINYRAINFRLNNGKTIAIYNTNHLLRDYTFCNGMKTGYTDKAGHCLIASGTWHGKDVIAVIYGEPVRPKIWKDGLSLLVYGLGLKSEEVAAARLTPPPAPKKNKKKASSSSKSRKHKS